MFHSNLAAGLTCLAMTIGNNICPGTISYQYAKKLTLTLSHNIHKIDEITAESIKFLEDNMH